MSVKEELVKTRAVLREKFKNLKRLQQEDNAQIQSFFKPIVNPLRELINVQKSSMYRPPPPPPPSSPGPHQRQQAFYHSSPLEKKKNKIKQLEDASVSEIKDDDLFTTVVGEVDADSVVDDNDDDDNDDDGDNREPPEFFIETPEETAILRRTDTTLFKENLGNVAGDYMKLFNRPDLEKTRDQTYGIRYEPRTGQFMIGSKSVEIDKNDVKIGEEWFEGTPGLYELLIKKHPNLSVVAEKDKHNYKKILIKTNVHRRGFVEYNPVKANAGFKYMKVIKPLLNLKENPRTSLRSPPIPSTSSLKKLGKGYQFYSNPNELVKRLKILHASSIAGNNSHHNEIVDILAELKRIGCIKV